MELINPGFDENYFVTNASNYDTATWELTSTNLEQDYASITASNESSQYCTAQRLLYHAVDGNATSQEQMILNRNYLQDKHDRTRFKVFSGWTIWKDLNTTAPEAYGDAQMFTITHFNERQTPLIGTDTW